MATTAKRRRVSAPQAGGISTRDVQILTPVLVFRSQASFDAADGPGVISNELNFPVAGEIGISVLKVMGQFRVDGGFTAGADGQSIYVQELDLDEDNTDVEGAAVDVDIENANTSRIFVQQGGLVTDFTTSGQASIETGKYLDVDFSSIDLVSRPMTNQNMRHHVRQAQPTAFDHDFTAMLLIYYHVVRLSDRALFLLASRRSF